MPSSKIELWVLAGSKATDSQARATKSVNYAIDFPVMARSHNKDVLGTHRCAKTKPGLHCLVVLLCRSAIELPIRPSLLLDIEVAAHLYWFACFSQQQHCRHAPLFGVVRI